MIKYSIKIVKHNDKFSTILNGHRIRSHVDLDQLHCLTGYTMNRMHQTLGLPEIKMADLFFEQVEDWWEEDIIKRKARSELAKVERRREESIARKERKKARATAVNLLNQFKNLAKVDGKLAITKMNEERRLANIERRAANNRP